MWRRFWLFTVITLVYSQDIDNRSLQDGSQVEWRWEMSPIAQDASTTGFYYLKLPQAEQRVRYTADESGYHGAVAVNTTDDQYSHTASFALGQTAIDLNKLDSGVPTEQTKPANLVSSNTQPINFYLIQQQFTAPTNQENIQISAPQHIQYSTPYITPLYQTQTLHPTTNEIPEKKSENLSQNRSELTEYDVDQNTAKPLPLIQVFKDHNCSEEVSETKKENDEKSKDLIADISSYEIHKINNFGSNNEVKRPLTYRGAVHFKVETPRPNARNERFYYTTDVTPIITEKTIDFTQEGIRKLVASTQDLISNDDLLKINNAAEKHVAEPSDDLIKPKPRFGSRTETRQNKQTEITVKAKIQNIVHNIETKRSKQNKIDSNFNGYKFASPIVVADNPYVDFKEQIVNNLVSTMVPYIADGYEIVGVKKTFNSNENVVDVTPRPIGQNYLKPITVALRLLNANHSEDFNTIDDHEASDSELIETVEKPREKTVVEVQESIPVEITHINEVEVHEYLEDGKANDKKPLELARSLYNTYVNALQSSKKIQENSINMLYRYGSSYENSDSYEDSKENLEESANSHSEVHVRPNEDTSRSESIYYNDYGNQNIIQPIVIEKEVPITKFVDRYIEKPVPYPEPVKVPIPVDRPVPVAVPYEKVVEKPVEVTRYVDKPYPVEVPKPYPVKVPYLVEQKVYVDRPIHVPFPVEKVIEKQLLHPVPIPTPVGIPYEVQVEHKVLYPVTVEKPVPIPIEVEKPVPVDRVVHKEVPVPYPVEKHIPYPVPYETKVGIPIPIEKRVPVPVEKIVEKPVTVTKYVNNPIPIEVPRPVAVPVPIPQPYPVDRVVEKQVPYPVPVDRIVEKKVPVQVPYQVEKLIERIVEKPVLVTKYVDKPYPVEKRVPYAVPYEVKVPYPVEKIVEKPVHIPVPIYRYYGEESRINSHYQKPNQQSQIYAELIQNLRDKNRTIPIKSTMWGNQYASSYNYDITNKQNNLKNLLNYITNTQNRFNQSFNRNLGEYRMRRTDRTPKVLKIEYGGFKPPLIPSTEVDLDGVPINKQNE